MKNALVLNFFPAFIPPGSGGELRYFNFYKNLSQYANITLLSPTYSDAKFEVVTHSQNFREYRIPKQDNHNNIHSQLDLEGFSTEFSALTCAYSAQQLNNYHSYYLKLYPDCDLIIHESPFMLNYDLFLGIDNKPRIYNSYNVEYNLLKQIYQGATAKKHLDFIFQLEKRLVEQADFVFATSNEEREKFNQLYNVNYAKIKLAPNGINLDDLLVRKAPEKQTKTVFFIGSNHPPNIEAAHFIIDHLAAQCPEIEFLIAGSCCDSWLLKRTLDPIANNIKLLGKVDETQKNNLFQTVDIAINPMFSGAGTNLKTLEFLSMGIPMISTDVGVRGIDIIDGKHFIQADKDNFAIKLNTLIEDKKQQQRISTQAKKMINEQFDWKVIAKNCFREISTLFSDTSQVLKHKSILLLNDFEVSSPYSGGTVRINRLYGELSKSCHIVLLCLNDQGQLKKTWITPNFLEISFPKTKQHLKEEGKVSYKYDVSSKDIISSYMIKNNKYYMQAVKSAASAFDICILSHPYMYEAIESIKLNYLIHESHNHELVLKQEMLLKHPDYKKLIKQVQKIESNSCLQSDLIISVSDDDHDKLQAYFTTDNSEHSKQKKSQIITIKNGVDIISQALFEQEFITVKSMFKGHTTILFVGSGHLPNITAVKHIIHVLAKSLNDCYFIIIGSVCGTVADENIPSNVLLFGQLDNNYKNVLCSICDMAINPMLGGSGSNLKLAEYFSWKLPTITTSFGARGYDIQHQYDSIICDLAQFSENIRKLQTDKNLAEKLSKNAYNYVKSNLQWSTLAKQYRDLLDINVYKINRKKLLIITYRLTNPPLGGAEVYLYELIKQLDKHDNFDISIAYIDAYDIENQYHFSIHASHNSQLIPAESESQNFTHSKFQKFSYNELNDREKLENARKLMKNWVDEFLLSARKFTHFYQQPLLMGGWNFPELLEQTEESAQIWSSATAEIYLKDVKKLSIKAYSNTKKTISLMIGQQQLKQQTVKGSFELEISIPNDGVLQIQCSEDQSFEDPRPLGILVYRILCDTKSMDLSYGYRDFMKQQYQAKYIEELIAIATTRDKVFDQLFQKTRGINSQPLEQYLDQNTANFDILLGHSIPFASTVLTAKYAQKYHKPYTLLPHFHFDDEFYHWNSYYQAMQNADTVFASPTISIEKFYNQLNIKTREVPGGGINKNEYASIDSQDFIPLYPSDKPFFLVLGRKSGAKNYALIMDAIETINSQQHQCNLLMIGRDEDATQITSKYTTYLGEQPRGIVLAALKNCTALISMSESESFGIVIVEAWMLKRPVIINENCPAFIELVQDRENGLHANKNNLCDKIDFLLNNKDKANQWGLNGYNQTDKFTWPGISKIFNQQLLALCSVVKPQSGDLIKTQDYSQQKMSNRQKVELQQVKSNYDNQNIHDPDFYYFKNISAKSTFSILDIGANRGQSIVSFKTIYPQARIISFEANPLFFPILDRVKQWFDNVSVYHFGLGNVNSTLEFMLPVVDGIQYLEEGSTRADAFEKPWVKERLAGYGKKLSFEKFPVEIKKCKEVMPDISIDIIKIDVEGAELDVLLGMKQLIEQQHPLLLIENSDWENVTEFLSRKGYDCYQYLTDENKLQPLKTDCTNSFYIHQDDQKRWKIV